MSLVLLMILGHVVRVVRMYQVELFGRVIPPKQKNREKE